MIVSYMPGLIDILKEQSSFGFTGRINLLSSANGQYLGVIYQDQGLIVGAQMKGIKGKRAIMKMIFDDVEGSQSFKYVIEPEILNNEVTSLRLSVDELKKEAQRLIQEYIDSKKLRPSPLLRMLIAPEIITSKVALSYQEFCILATLSEWPSVKDIYEHSPLMEFETTHALVSLRKKKALKVFQNT